MKVRTFEEAIERIDFLEKENAELKKELEYYRNRKMSGRKVHNATFKAHLSQSRHIGCRQCQSPAGCYRILRI